MPALIHNDAGATVKTSTAITTPANQVWMTGIKTAAASASSAACVKTMLQPIDAVKTIQQFRQSTGSTALSIPQACRHLLGRPGGALNFYAGLGVTLVGALPSVGIYFGVYAYCKQRLSGTEFGRQHPTASIALSAAIGNTVASFSRAPCDVVKQKLQTGLYTNTSTVWHDFSQSNAAIKVLFPKGGVRAQMLRDVPQAAITLTTYEGLRKKFNADAQKGSVKDFLLGGLAGGVGVLAISPFDTVKTRLQTYSTLYGGSLSLCATTLWREGGLAAFYRGMWPHLMQKVPASMLFFGFYEFFKRFYRANQHDNSVTKQK